MLPRILQTPVDPAVIDLGIGNPAPELLPLERLEAAARRFFAQGDRDPLQYGYEPGDGYLRRELAALIQELTASEADPETLLITNGASQGLDLICSLYTRPGDIIFVEEPSYFLALRIFADHHLRPVAVPIDQDGLQVEALERLLRQHRPRLLYTIPTYQNPSGASLSLERRQQVSALSREYDFLIVADEVYHLLSYEAAPPIPLAAFTGQGNVISLNSFSKILAPGLRLGWLQTDAARLQQIAGCGLLDSGGGFNPFTSAIVRWLIATGELPEHLQLLRQTYARRARALAAALQRHLPEIRFHPAPGGFFIWAELPDGVDAEALLPYAGQYHTGYRPGIRFSSQGGQNSFLRLCFAYYKEQELEEGVRRLAKAWKAFQKKGL